jgi:hypothetical protein
MSKRYYDLTSLCLKIFPLDRGQKSLDLYYFRRLDKFLPPNPAGEKMQDFCGLVGLVLL